MEGENSPHSSLCVVRAEELFPKTPLEKDDDALTVPLTELAGEFVRFLGPTDDGVLAISNYRLYLHTSASGAEISVPLGLIESALARDLNQLIISCKDASTVKCSFDTSERCAEWQRRITLHIGVPANLETLFAFPFYAWSAENKALDTEWAMRMQRAPKLDEDFEKERVRLKFRLDTEGGPWRVSKVNVDFKLCGSYPRQLLVPASIDDATLHNIATFRSSRRIPAVVWRHRASGAILARCSQPELGWLGWRNHNDEAMLKAFVDACATDRLEVMRARGVRDVPTPAATTAAGGGEELNGGVMVAASSPSTDGAKPKPNYRKLLIIDARSYTSAVTNRARGGGCECTEYYPDAEIEFMSLGNIHTIRKSFHQLRQLCASPPDNASWLSSLERCLWLQHLAVLLGAAMTVCRTIELCGRPVLVHCSDGWDRTPQILATSQLCMDPYYRTVEGFRILVEREWLGFGHKFADRCGHGPGSDETNERCPVFLQWLDAVHQIHRQFPCSFEFSAGYLIKLAQHSHSCIFGTFLCNTLKDRMDNSLFERTFSVWGFLAEPIYRNPLYVPNRERVLWPAHNVRDLVLWSDVYLGSLGNQQLSADYPRGEPIDTSVHGALGGSGVATAGGPGSNGVGGGGTGGGVVVNGGDAKGTLCKTRSYDDLLTAGAHNGQLPRRSSDPNMSAESHFDVKLPSDPSMETMSDNGIDIDSNHSGYSNGTVADAGLLRNGSAQLSNSQQIAAVCSDTSRKLDSLTAELQNGTLEGETEDCDVLRALANGDRATTTRRRSDEEMDYKNGEQDVVDGPQSFASVVQNGQLSEIMRSVNLNDVQLPLAAEQNQILSSVDASCSDALYPRTQYQTLRFNGTLPPYTSMSSAASSNVDEALEPSTHTASQSQQLVAQFPCDNCVSAVDVLPADILYSGHSISSGHPAMLGRAIGSHPGNSSSMDESIMIQPEFQRMDITNGGGQVIGIGGNSNNSTVGLASRREFVTVGRTYSMPTPSSAGGHSTAAAAATSSSSNGSVSPPLPSMHHPAHHHQMGGGGGTSRFSTPGLRSLPLTPPASHAYERPGVAISCPDGLAHALSEQNLRLQQIVQEHRIREEALQRELYSTRLALVRKIPPCLLNQHIIEDSDDILLNDDDYRVAHSEGSSIGRCSQSPTWPSVWRRSSFSSVNAMLNDAENASICSWEAVEEQRGYAIGGGGGSSNGSTNLSGSVLWVPDHAVSQCTSCQTEFWLGRRKHHCRSCGQIFCADCSEFWAALPDERLYQPVRLCGPCYHSVTTKTQMLVMQQHKALKTKEPSPDKLNQPLLMQSQLSQLPPSSTPSATVCAVGSVCSKPPAINQCATAARPMPPTSAIPIATPAMQLVRQQQQQQQLQLQQHQQQQQQQQKLQQQQPQSQQPTLKPAPKIPSLLPQSKLPQPSAVLQPPPPPPTFSHPPKAAQPSAASSATNALHHKSPPSMQLSASPACAPPASNEPCKHAAVGCCSTSTHDPSALKAPTATN